MQGEGEVKEHERSHWPPVTPAWLRQHGLEIQVLGGFTLLAAALCLVLVNGPAGVILGIVFGVLGVVKIALGLHWRRNAER